MFTKILFVLIVWYCFIGARVSLLLLCAEIEDSTYGKFVVWADTILGILVGLLIGIWTALYLTT